MLPSSIWVIVGRHRCVLLSFVRFRIKRLISYLTRHGREFDEKVPQAVVKRHFLHVESFGVRN